MRGVHPLLLLLGCATPCAAQQTWIVDPNGGGHFTTVVAAIAAAAPGDTLSVRGGSYGQSHVVDKTLHIVGDPAFPPPALNTLHVFPGLGAVVSVVRAHVTILDLSGIVSLDEVTGLGCTVGGGTAAFTRCSFFPEFRVLGGDVALDRCTLSGRNSFYIQTLQCTSVYGTPGLEVLGGTVDIANSVITGGGAGQVCGFTMVGPLPGISNAGGAVRVARSQISGGPNGGGVGAPVAMSAGSLQYDAATVFVGGPPPGTQVFLPAADGTSAAPGAVIACEVAALPNVAAIVVGSLGMRAPIASAFGPLWFDPQAYVGLAFGMTDASGVLAASIPVPLGVQNGIAITVQGGALAPGTLAPTAATPVVLHVK